MLAGLAAGATALAAGAWLLPRRGLAAGEQILNQVGRLAQEVGHVHPDDMGVAKLAQRFGLALEALEIVWVHTAQPTLKQDLHRIVSAGLAMRGLVDDAHSPARQLTQESKGTKLRGRLHATG